MKKKTNIKDNHHHHHVVINKSKKSRLKWVWRSRAHKRTNAWFSALSSMMWSWPVSLQREVESWKPSGEVTGSFHRWPGPGPNNHQYPGGGLCWVPVVPHFYFQHMLQETVKLFELDGSNGHSIDGVKIKRKHRISVQAINESLSLWLLSVIHRHTHTHVCTHTHTYTQSERFHDWMHLHLAPTPRKSDSSRSPFWLSDLSFGSMGLKCTKWLCFLCHSGWRQNAFVTKNCKNTSNGTSSRVHWASATGQPLTSSVVTRCLQKDTLLPAWRWQHRAGKQRALHQ